MKSFEKKALELDISMGIWSLKNAWIVFADFEK